MQFQKNGTFAPLHLFFQKTKVKLKHWHETLTWEYVILGFDYCLGKMRK